MSWFSEHKWKIISVVIGPAMAFSVWAADRFVDQRVETKVQAIVDRLGAIENKLSAIQQELKDLKGVP